MQVAKSKLRWRTIKWLLENKKEIVDKLTTFQETFFETLKNRNIESFNLKTFGDIMVEFGITMDKELINKLFWLFDEDSSGDVDLKEIAFGIENFLENSLDNKLKSKLNYLLI